MLQTVGSSNFLYFLFQGLKDLPRFAFKSAGAPDPHQSASFPLCSQCCSYAPSYLQQWGSHKIDKGLCPQQYMYLQYHELSASYTSRIRFKHAKGSFCILTCGRFLATSCFALHSCYFLTPWPNPLQVCIILVEEPPTVPQSKFQCIVRSH